MNIPLSPDQCETLLNILEINIVVKESQGIKTTQEREILFRIRATLFINESKQLRAVI